VLMNTRGLMELIVLNIGLDLGVISPTLFAMMIVMALVTTLATTPALHLLLPNLASSRRSDTFKARIHAMARAEVHLTADSSTV